MSNKINLEEILRNKIGYMGNEPKLTKLISERASGYDVLSAMREACKQAVELAAENAKLGYIRTLVDDPKEGDDAYKNFPIVDKESILNIINLIE